jgi:hypothetical protein
MRCAVARPYAQPVGWSKRASKVGLGFNQKRGALTASPRRTARRL